MAAFAAVRIHMLNTIILFKACFFIFLFYFFLACAFDLKYRAVPTMIHLIFILTGFPLFLYLNIFTVTAFDFPILNDLVLRFLPGLLLLFVSIVSRGSLGIGDAVFMTISAFYIDLRSILFIFISGFLSAFIVSAVMLIYGKMKNKDLHHMSLPLIPLMLPGLYPILMNLNL
ncbi:prepilin peptidase [Oribacterium sp. FC2011]|uniref:prepilin peptidase n=1 Tax=Oribacterium sp. FC2011 TaxID=1408311 RepID=UPI0004E13681|nr:prepilin peptidase [Oribacterium sp. FC2011]